MATQSLEFGYTTGQTLTAQLFADGSDTVAATASSVTEATNRKGRYVAAFTDVPAGTYLLVYFLGGSGAGSEKYVLTLTTATFQPQSEKTKEDVANAVDALRSGAGENVVTVTITDASSNALQGARVSIVGTTLKQTTGSSGIVRFNLDTGGYKLRVSAPSGYVDPDDQTFTVDGAESLTIALASSGSVTPPDNPLLSTLTVKCLDEQGAVEAGVTIDAKLVAIPSGSTGIAYVGTKQTATSDANGVAQLTVVRQATYHLKRGTSTEWTEVTIEDAGTTTVTSFLGAP